MVGNGRPVMNDVIQHRWWRDLKTEQLSEVTGKTIQVLVDPSDSDHRDSHWVYMRTNRKVVHQGARRDIKTTLYLVYGRYRGELEADMYGLQVTPGGRDLPDDVGCGNEECVNPWHMGLMAKSVWLAAMNTSNIIRRKNAGADLRGQVVDAVDGSRRRVVVGAEADKMFVMLCILGLDHLIESEEFPSVPVLGHYIDQSQPSLVVDAVREMLIGYSDVREVHARAGVLSVPRNRGVEDGVAEMERFREAREKALGRWQDDGRSSGGDGGGGAKSSRNRRIPPRPGKKS